MAALEELREQLDSIDAQIVKLYERRMRVCASVGKYKIENGKKVKQTVNEREKNSGMYRTEFCQNITKKESKDFING